MQSIRTIAIYLPQFHPIPENDLWWGKGFTEWTNVAKARPLFRGHYQPQLPTDLGYYDLRVNETRIAQAELAQTYGISGFAYYHYWFSGRRLLNEPFDSVLKSGVPDFPFCLFWANETWSRRWLGEEKDILIRQSYSEQDDKAHINWLITAFRDRRYLRINNRPVFIIYHPTMLPDIAKTIEIFRTECLKSNIENPYLIGSNSITGAMDLREAGFDNILNFEPRLGVLPYFLSDRISLRKLLNNMKFGILSSRLKIYDYSMAHDRMINTKLPYPYFPCTFVNWDNSPRRGRNGIIIHNSSPEKFGFYFHQSINRLKEMNFSEEENLVFINAWNEWAEGNYLEPNDKYKSLYLEALKSAITSFNNE